MIADLTCDSDGRIDHYVDSDGVDVSLPLHAPRTGEPYRLGIFLVGAYQETLGDIHNLFGDTDAVNVRMTADGGYEFCARQARRHHRRDARLRRLRPWRAARGVSREDRAAGIGGEDAARIEAALEGGLTGYTYLAEAVTRHCTRACTIPHPPASTSRSGRASWFDATVAENPAAERQS